MHICISLSCLRSSCKRRSSNGNRPATAQHDGTHTPRQTVPSCCAVVRSCGLYLLRPVLRQYRRVTDIHTTTAYRASIASRGKNEEWTTVAALPFFPILLSVVLFPSLSAVSSYSTPIRTDTSSEPIKGALTLESAQAHPCRSLRRCHDS